MTKIQQYIADLKAAGISHNQIAERISSEIGCDCSQTTISRIANGGISNPSWNLGNAIQQLHEALVQQAA